MSKTPVRGSECQSFEVEARKPPNTISGIATVLYIVVLTSHQPNQFSSIHPVAYAIRIPMRTKIMSSVSIVPYPYSPI